MNRHIWRTTGHAAGWFCLVMAVAMLAPMVVDLFEGSDDWLVFLTSSGLVGLIAILLIVTTQGPPAPFSLRLGFVMVNALWLSVSVTASVPLYLSSLGLSYADALFEAVSGVTTTGSTVLSGLDDMPPGLLLWRSIMQWLGGIGIIAMGVLLMPFLRVGGMQVFQMESSNRLDNPMPRFREFTTSLVLLYLSLTFACALGYAATGMTVFDAVNHAMTTVSTGGYSTHDSSMGEFGLATQVVGIVFMLAGALPFIAFLRAMVLRDVRKALDPQVPVLVAILVVLASLVAFVAMPPEAYSPHGTMIRSLFNIISIVTTTGYASADYSSWGPGVVGIFLLAMFLGGCAGSTSGGIKTYRLIVMYQTTRNALRELVYPDGVFVERYGDTVMSSAAVRSVTVFLSGFFGILFASTVILAMLGLDLVTAFSGALTAVTNVGPGLGDIIGPAGNFSSLPDLAKWLLSAVMLLGRLEIMTVLVLFSPVFWRR